MKRLTFVLQLIYQYVCKSRLVLLSCKRTPEMKPLIYCNEVFIAVSPRVCLKYCLGIVGAGIAQSV
jgi:hypothetical protein